MGVKYRLPIIQSTIRSPGLFVDISRTGILEPTGVPLEGRRINIRTWEKKNLWTAALRVSKTQNAYSVSPMKTDAMRSTGGVIMRREKNPGEHISVMKRISFHIGTTRKRKVARAPGTQKGFKATAQQPRMRNVEITKRMPHTTGICTGSHIKRLKVSHLPTTKAPRRAEHDGRIMTKPITLGRATKHQTSTRSTINNEWRRRVRLIGLKTSCN